MYSIAILTHQTDFVLSFKSALAFRAAEDLKFLFFTEVQQLKSHMLQYGQPDLLILDKQTKTIDQSAFSAVPVAFLSDQTSSDTNQISIFQSTDGLIQSIRRCLSQADFYQSKVKHQAHSGMTKTVWLFDPQEWEWSKQCFAHLISDYYGKNSNVLAADFSIFGNPYITLPDSVSSGLSEALMDFSGLGQQSRMGPESLSDRAGDAFGSRFHMIRASNHPFDLMMTTGSFFEKGFLKLAEPYELRCIYTGMPDADLLRQLARYADQVWLFDSGMTGTASKLRQMADWLRQVSPRLKTDLLEAANFDSQTSSAVARISAGISSF